ncbi:hypothetical protein YN1_8890 [Nanoarchaeota archaeon]
MKSISPIIATILLIVIVIAIAALLYAWLSGMFNSITSSTTSNTNKLTDTISFSIVNLYCSNGLLYFTIYNNGNIPIDINNSIITINQNNTVIVVNGNNIICNNNIINPGDEEICYINNITCIYNPYTNINPQVSLTYQGISNSNNLGIGYEILNGNNNTISSYSSTNNTNSTSSSPSNTTNTTSSTPPSNTTNSTISNIPYYTVTLYNTQPINTPSPFQQDIAICNGTTIQNPYFEILGYNSTSGSYSASVTLPQNATLYLCNGYSVYAPLSSISWNIQEIDNVSYGSLGYQNSNLCSDYSSSSTNVVTSGVAINTNEYYNFQGITINDVSNVIGSVATSYNYTLNTTSNVTMSIVCDVNNCTISVPSGCQTLINITSGGYGTSFFAVCYNQSPGTYNISIVMNVQYSPVDILIGIYEFSPYPPNLGSNFAYVNNQTLFNLINSNGSNVYFFSNTSNINGSLLYSWYEGEADYNNLYCKIWWINISNGIPTNSNYTIYMYIGNSSNNYYSQYYPYVGASPQVISGYDNGQDVFISYGYFNNTFDGWIGYKSQYATTNYVPTATPYGIEMLNNTINESTYILPYNNGNIPEIPLIVEEAWYYNSLNLFNGDGSTISLFGNTSDQVPGLYTISIVIGNETPVANDSIFSQFEYISSPDYYFSYDLLASAYQDHDYSNINFQPTGGTFYTYLIVNQTYAQSGWYQYTLNQVWIPLTLLDTYSYSLYMGNYNYANLNYNPIIYPTLEIGAGTGDGQSYQYVEWVIARAYPPNGVMPSIYIS